MGYREDPRKGLSFEHLELPDAQARSAATSGSSRYFGCEKKSGSAAALNLGDPAITGLLICGT